MNQFKGVLYAFLPPLIELCLCLSVILTYILLCFSNPGLCVTELFGLHNSLIDIYIKCTDLPSNGINIS